MAPTTAYVKLSRAALVPESRGVQARLMTGLALTACCGVFATLLLMGSAIQREADTLDGVWGRQLVPVGCAVAGPFEEREAPLADVPADAGCAPEPADWQADGGKPAATAALAVERPAAVAVRPSQRAPRAPTYIRIRKPQPRPDPTQLALEALRGGL